MIEAATGNFSSYNKIGEGGFGPVYKVNYSLFVWLIIKKKIFQTISHTSL